MPLTGYQLYLLAPSRHWQSLTHASSLHLPFPLHWLSSLLANLLPIRPAFSALLAYQSRRGQGSVEHNGMEGHTVVPLQMNRAGKKHFFCG